MAIEVSIIVPCFNEQTYIESVLQSILAQEPPQGGFEVIVADGMSDDGTRVTLTRLAASDSRLQVLDNPARIVSAGLNAAIRSSRGKIIIRMDAHTEYAPNYVVECLKVLNQTGADNVGGPARTRARSYTQAVIAAAYHSPFAVGGARFHDANYEGYLDTVTYGCWRREVFNRIGLFDENMLNTEDDEFNLRLLRSGGKIWQSPRIKSWYQPRHSLGGLFRQYLQYGYWKVRLMQKHRIPASLRHIVPGTFVLLLSCLAVAAVWSSIAAMTWLAIFGVYATLNLIASLWTAARAGWKMFFLLPVVFACYHFSYGYGFLQGFYDFIVCRRSPRAAYTKSSRTSSA